MCFVKAAKLKYNSVQSIRIAQTGQLGLIYRHAISNALGLQVQAITSSRNIPAAWVSPFPLSGDFDSLLSATKIVDKSPTELVAIPQIKQTKKPRFQQFSLH